MEQAKRNRQIQVIMGIYSVTALILFLVFGAVYGGIGEAFKGFIAVVQMPSQMTMDYFLKATVGGTFLNVGLVGLCQMLVFKLSKASLNGTTLMAFFLTMGFAFFGMNPINIWPCILGTLVFCLVSKEKFSSQANIAVFSTAMAPFVSEMFFRYTAFEGMPALRVLGGLGVGILAGFLMPILCKHGPNMHKGNTLYNAASAAGLISILLYSLMFKAPGVEAVTNTAIGEENLAVPLLTYVILTAGLDIALGWYMKGKNFEGVAQIFKNSGYGIDLTKDQPGLAAINVGIFELFMTAYFCAIGSPMTAAPTLAAIICMLSTAPCGTHALNMIPIIIGYAIACAFSSFTLTTPAIILALCYASALTPIPSGFGPLAGILAGIVHAVLVTQVVTFYNAFCFYNGGFTCFLTAVIYGTVLDYFFERDTKMRWNPIPILKKR